MPRRSRDDRPLAEWSRDGMRIPILLVAVVALGGVATANSNYRTALAEEEQPPISFGHADRLEIDRADLSLATDGAQLRGTLRLVVSTSDPERADRSILIAVPRGTKVDSLAVTIDEERLDGVIAYATAARSAYENTVERMTDPALLEWVRATPGQTWMRLRVFPVRPGHPATLRLGLAMPRTTEVSIDGSGTRIGVTTLSVDDDVVEWHELDARFALAVPEIAKTGVSERGADHSLFVRDGVSLVAGPTVIAGHQACPEGEVCLRMMRLGAPSTPSVRAWQARVRTHRMRLPSRRGSAR